MAEAPPYMHDGSLKSLEAVVEFYDEGGRAKRPLDPEMRKLGLTLTVLPAYTYVYDTLKVEGIPQNWIIDPEGAIRLKGYDAATVKWEAEMRDAIEKLRTGKGK